MGKHNYWLETDFIDKVTDEEEYESLHKSVLYSLVNNEEKVVNVGSTGAIDADDIHLKGYFMVVFKSDQ